ncbi:MAG: MarR family transcriptional regulator [Fibrobacteraceae bacterium]
MENANENENNRCPLCRNHCPVDDLGCERGRRYQAELQKNKTQEPDEKLKEKPAAGKDSSEAASREERLTNLFFYCSHILHHRYWHARGQGRILHFLHHHGSMTQRELQEYAGIQSASLSELLEKAEAGGFLSRLRNKEDRRTVDVSLTELGKKSARDFDEEKSEMNRNLFSALTGAEQEELEALLSKIADAWGKSLDEEPCGFGGRMHRHIMEHSQRHMMGRGRRHGFWKGE